jgi:dihydrofolate reductase
MMLISKVNSKRSIEDNRMRKVIVQTEISLDAVQENPHHWVFDYHDDAVTKYLNDQVFKTDTLLMGRVTYEAFAEVWPTRAGDPIADRFNSMPKFVASRTLKGPLTWNATLFKGDIAKEVAELKQQPGQDIVLYGVGELVNTLIQHGLIDELRFLVFPIAVGNGQRVFENIDKTAMKLLETKVFSTGVVALHYQPQQKA